MATPTYQQAIKDEARRFVLGRAVTTLTTDRDRSVIVAVPEFDEALEYAISFLERHNLAQPLLRPDLVRHAAEWRGLHKSVVGSKTPADLRVLYLSGPEPQNDLSVLLELGVVPQNIWAIESKAAMYQGAVEQLRRADQYLRIHHGGLDTSFDSTNERFDIVYIDDCGALPSARANTVRNPLLMFHRERLAAMGVLITNFAQPPIEKRSEYERLLCYYFAPRYNDCPCALICAGADPAEAHADPTYLLPFIQDNFDETYSDFITRFLVDLGREIVPCSRIYDNKDIRDKYFSPGAQLQKAIERATKLNPPPHRHADETAEEYLKALFMQIGDVLLNSAGYPVLTFLRNAAGDRTLDGLMQPLLAHKLRSESIEKSFTNAAILAKVIEGHWGAASTEMRVALAQSWIDSRGGVFCDIPLPNLLINSLFGIYGHPYLPNARRSVRLSYTAKSTKMYTDLLVLDQCRYFFDYLPTIDLIPNRFRSVGYQLVLRACLDQMGRHDFSSSAHPFRGAALGAFGEFPSARFYDFLPRAERPPWVAVGEDPDISGGGE